MNYIFIPKTTFRFYLITIYIIIDPYMANNHHYDAATAKITQPTHDFQNMSLPKQNKAISIFVPTLQTGSCLRDAGYMLLITAASLARND